MAVFDELFKKRSAFRTVFDSKNKASRLVLAHLRKFCPSDPTKNAGSPIDEKQVYINIGRRQVLSYILTQINMPDEVLTELAREEINGR